MACKPRWAIPLIAAVTVVVFLTLVAGSASAAIIRGTVTDANGVKVAGATVTLYQGGAEYLHDKNPTRTDATGYYEFSALPDGAYSIQADAGGYFSPSDSRVLAGNDVEVNLKIPGFDSTVPVPTVQVYVTATPTPAPPTPKPTVKTAPTLVPLPTPEPEPGFGLLLALIAIGIVAAFRKP